MSPSRHSRIPFATATISLGYVLIDMAGLLVLFGLYLSVPQFH
jgi:hypothetical protein